MRRNSSNLVTPLVELLRVRPAVWLLHALVHLLLVTSCRAVSSHHGGPCSGQTAAQCGAGPPLDDLMLSLSMASLAAKVTGKSSFAQSP